jgi:hypothetical protein
MENHLDDMLMGFSMVADVCVLWDAYRSELIPWLGEHTMMRNMYSAEKDRISARSFHAACDGKSPSLIVLSVEDGAGVFGGFTTVPWQSTGGWTKDKGLQTFVFWLKRPGSAGAVRFQLAPSAQFATFHHAARGPCFLCAFCVLEGRLCEVSHLLGGGWTGERGHRALFGDKHGAVLKMDRMEVFLVESLSGGTRSQTVSTRSESVVSHPAPRITMSRAIPK